MTEKLDVGQFSIFGIIKGERLDRWACYLANYYIEMEYFIKNGAICSSKQLLFCEGHQNTSALRSELQTFFLSTWKIYDWDKFKVQHTNSVKIRIQKDK